jgi:hypothetical protein
MGQACSEHGGEEMHAGFSMETQRKRILGTLGTDEA